MKKKLLNMKKKNLLLILIIVGIIGRIYPQTAKDLSDEGIKLYKSGKCDKAYFQIGNFI